MKHITDNSEDFPNSNDDDFVPANRNDNILDVNAHADRRSDGRIVKISSKQNKKN